MNSEVEALLSQLEQISQQIRHSENREVKAACGVLLALSGSLRSGSSEDLLSCVTPFCRRIVAELGAVIKSEQN